MKQTAVEFLEEQIEKFHNWKLNPIYDENCFDEIELRKSIQQAKEMENKQCQDYARFAIECDRKDLPILDFNGYSNLKTNKI